eukprot:scaffold84461_cov44-Attheya_sp.AAC.2
MGSNSRNSVGMGRRGGKVGMLSMLMVTTLMASFRGCAAFSLSKTPVSQLLKQESDTIAALKAEASSVAPSSVEYLNDVYFLRYCLHEGFESPAARVEALKQNVKWMYGTPEGKSICEAADSAIAGAMEGGKWNNDGVLAAAPHSSTISKFIMPKNAVTTTSNTGDLVYCIRAGQIDDNALMSSVSIEEMAQFFLYCKHVNAQVANQRSLEQDRLVCVVTANDLTGVQLVGGSGDFRKALGNASTRANDLYPAVSGPTLLLNLPVILSALVKLFTPLFPPAVRERLKFERGPLSKVEDLTQILPGQSDPNPRATFVSELDSLIYTD